MGVAANGVARVLVTGGSGFIGTNLIERYVAQGVEWVNFDPLPPRNPAQRSQWHEGDVRDGERLARLVATFRPTHLLHLGARTDMDGADVSEYSSNTAGVQSVVDVLTSLQGQPRTVFASTRLVTPVGYVPQDELDMRPDTPYGESKAIGERIVRGASIEDWVIVRPTSIWGPWFGVPYRQFFDAVLKGRYVHPRGMTVEKTFGFVGNSVDQLDEIAGAPPGRLHGRTFYLGDPPIEVGEFADTIARRAGVRKPRRVSRRLLKAAARVGDLGAAAGILGVAPLTTSRLQNLCTNMVFDIEETLKEAGGPRYTELEGIDRTLTWIQKEDPGRDSE